MSLGGNTVIYTNLVLLLQRKMVCKKKVFNFEGNVWCCFMRSPKVTVKSVLGRNSAERER